jgi:hypothetical protein
MRILKWNNLSHLSFTLCFEGEFPMIECGNCEFNANDNDKIDPLCECKT